LPELPFVDEHTIAVDAPPERAWDAVVAVSGRATGGRASGAFARLVGCDDVEAEGAPGQPGSTVVGFRVETARPPHELGLAGRHRFSEYRLTFRVEPLVGGGARVRAVTHARFPGVHGEVYRTLVIRSRIHVLVVRRLLSAIRQRASSGEERDVAVTSAGT
jgi:hypothetical protein